MSTKCGVIRVSYGVKLLLTPSSFMIPGSKGPAFHASMKKQDLGTRTNIYQGQMTPDKKEDFDALALLTSETINHRFYHNNYPYSYSGRPQSEC